MSEIRVEVTYGGPQGVAGDDAYVYMAWASDASGTGFTTTFNAALDFVAIKNTTTPIAAPAVGDFTGLWKNYKGATGANGSLAWQGTWASGHGTYHVNDFVYHAVSGYGKGLFRCILEHDPAVAATEPVVGGSAATYWETSIGGGQNGEVIMDGTPAENDIMLRGSSDKHVKTSGIQFEQTLTPAATNKAPASKAVADYIAAGVSTAAISGTSLAITGPIKPSILTKTATYEILDTDPDIVVVGAIGAHSTFTLPTAAANTGRIITLIIDGEPGAYNVIVDGEGAETINGAATKTNSTIYSYLRLLCNGTGWDIVGSGGTWT